MSLHPDYCERCEAIDEPDNNIVIGTVGDEDVCDECRREEIEETTFLSEQEALTVTLKQFGMTHEEIADWGNIEKSTVDEYSRRANQKLERSKKTVEYLDDDR